MGAAEIGLDTLLELEMDSDMLKVRTEGNVECLEPAEGEEGEKEAATAGPRAPSPVVDACTPELGKDGSGLADCAHPQDRRGAQQVGGRAQRLPRAGRDDVRRHAPRHARVRSASRRVPSEREEGARQPPSSLPASPLHLPLAPSSPSAPPAARPPPRRALRPPSPIPSRSSRSYASAQKKVLYEDYHLTLQPPLEVAPVGSLPPPDMAHYAALADRAPPYALGLPYLVDCLVEQVVRSHIAEDEAAAANADAELDAIAAFLAASAKTLVAPPKSAPALAAEAAQVASGASTLIPHGDAVSGRLHKPLPFGAPPTGDASAQHAVEAKLLDALPMVGKGRQGMPPASACLTEEERGAERTELHYFSRALAQRINANDPYRGSSPLDGPSPTVRGSRSTPRR